MAGFDLSRRLGRWRPTRQSGCPGVGWPGQKPTGRVAVSPATRPVHLLVSLVEQTDQATHERSKSCRSRASSARS